MLRINTVVLSEGVCSAIEQIKYNWYTNDPAVDEAVNTILSAWQAGRVPEGAHQRYDCLGAAAYMQDREDKAAMYAVISNALRGVYVEA